MKKLVALLLVACLLCFGGCKYIDQKPQQFEENSPLLIGIWQMTTYVTDAGESYDFTDKNVIFTYNDDFTGNKTVDGNEEYIFTYTYNGELLYTTAAYPNGRVNVMQDKSTVKGDTVTTYSYDEKATITLKKVGVPPSKTTTKATESTTAAMNEE